MQFLHFPRRLWAHIFHRAAHPRWMVLARQLSSWNPYHLKGQEHFWKCSKALEEGVLISQCVLLMWPWDSLGLIRGWIWNIILYSVQALFISEGGLVNSEWYIDEKNLTFSNSVSIWVHWFQQIKLLMKKKFHQTFDWLFHLSIFFSFLEATTRWLLPSPPSFSSFIFSYPFLPLFQNVNTESFGCWIPYTRSPRRSTTKLELESRLCDFHGVFHWCVLCPVTNL